jgi:hypothetical protein
VLPDPHSGGEAVADAFISYCREDSLFAGGNGMEKVLRSAGLSFWRDHAIGAGSNWSDELAQQLRSAHAVVVLWSSNSWNSHWVRQEAFYALMKGNLVPMMIKERSVLLEPPFTAIQTMQNDERGFPAIIDAVRRLAKA